MHIVDLGRLSVHHIEEWQGSFASPVDLFANFEPSAFDSIGDQIPRVYYALETDSLDAVLQSRVFKGGDLVVHYDARLGNDKEWLGSPVLGNLQTGFLDNRAADCFQPEDIDICSQLHIDHVGWNTHLSDGQWVPTFPNARFLFFRIERNYCDPKGGGEPDVLDIKREGPRYLAFGGGTHFCLAADLARLEGETAFKTFAIRLPALKDDPRNPRWRPGLLFRGLGELPVTW